MDDFSHNATFQRPAHKRQDVCRVFPGRTINRFRFWERGIPRRDTLDLSVLLPTVSLLYSQEKYNCDN